MIIHKIKMVTAHGYVMASFITCQLFFYNLAYAAELHHWHNQNLDLRILRELIDILHNDNLFINIYKTAQEQLQELENANNNNISILFMPQLRLVLEAQ